MEPDRVTRKIMEIKKQTKNTQREGEGERPRRKWMEQTL